MAKRKDDVIDAIKKMFVRGAPLIGATGAFGVYNGLGQRPGSLTRTI